MFLSRLPMGFDSGAGRNFAESTRMQDQEHWQGEPNRGLRTQI